MVLTIISKSAESSENITAQTESNKSISVSIYVPLKRRHSPEDYIKVETKNLLAYSRALMVEKGEFIIFLKSNRPLEEQDPIGRIAFERSEIAGAIYFMASFFKKNWKEQYLIEIFFAMIKHLFPALKEAGFNIYGGEAFPEIWVIAPKSLKILMQMGFQLSERNRKLWVKKLS